MPSSRMKSRPQVYPKVSFHLIRAINFISAAIVSGILVFFCIQLRQDGFKLPWTLIVVLLASLLALISLALTSVLYCCAFLSPLFNLILNVTIFLIWTVGYILLTWNMYGALGHSCSRANWASDDGMMICRTYKALYTFTLFGTLSQIGLIVLDVRSRRSQTKLGRYDNLAGATGAVGARGSGEVKLETLRQNEPLGGSGLHSHASSQDTIPYGVNDYDVRNNSSRTTRGGAGDIGTVRMDDFNNYNNYGNYGYQQYQAYQPHAAYANGGYGYGPQR